MGITVNSTPRLGVYGDGQLARLLAQAAQAKQIPVVIFTLNSKDSPCQGIATEFVEGTGWNDDQAFHKFIQKIDVIALENEFVSPQFLHLAESQGVRCYPSASSYEAVSDKHKQVLLAQWAGVKTPATLLLSSNEELKKIQMPAMLKALRGGYDGYGNYLVREENDLSAVAFLDKCGPCLSQELIDFDKEVAVMVVRSAQQNALSFPVVETVQENNICHFTLTPARLDRDLGEKVQAEARKIIDEMDGIGLFGVEFFIRGEEIIFNEIAPRPHNSAHLTIEACNISQFGALVDLILNLPVPNPSLKVPSAGMLNLLGTQNGPAHFQGDGFDKGALHLYGKKESRKGRKMGHYTLLGENAESVLDELKMLKPRYQI